MNEEIKRPEASEPRWPRWDYKTVWTNLSDTLARAKLYIGGSEDEEAFSKGGRLDADFLREKVGINPTDMVYCIVVFCHIDEWDRYRYVEEAFRVLRRGGRLCVNNVNLCSDAGWAVFETLRKIHPTQRPPYIGKCSTPAELEEYLK